MCMERFLLLVTQIFSRVKSNGIRLGISLLMIKACAARSGANFGGRFQCILSPLKTHFSRFSGALLVISRAESPAAPLYLHPWCSVYMYVWALLLALTFLSGYRSRDLVTGVGYHWFFSTFFDFFEDSEHPPSQNLRLSEGQPSAHSLQTLGCPPHFSVVSDDRTTAKNFHWLTGSYRVCGTCIYYTIIKEQILWYLNT